MIRQRRTSWRISEAMAASSALAPRHLAVAERLCCAVYAANLEMHPLDGEDRVADLKDEHGIGYCNITKCCTKVCYEHIHITENAIIPLKERVVDRFYDPLTRLLRIFK